MVMVAMRARTARRRPLTGTGLPLDGSHSSPFALLRPPNSSKRPAPRPSPYAPECVEGAFPEVRASACAGTVAFVTNAK